MKKVFITRRLPVIAKTLLEAHFEVDARDENSPYPATDIPGLVGEYDAILSTVSERFDASVLGPGLRVSVLSNYAVGLDNIDVETARKLGIAVYNTPGVVTNSTADLTMALLLALVRRIRPAQDFVLRGEWKAWNPEAFLGEELGGKTLGIIGYGQIGQAVARRAAGFGLKVLYFNKGRTIPSATGVDARAGSLDDIFEQADYISLHVPLNNTTRGMIDSEAIAKMRRTPVIINMARGDVVVTDDLAEGLRSGRIRGCALDVLAAAHMSGQHPVFSMDNVLIVPHIGTATMECRHDMARMAAENIIRHFQ